MMVIGNQILSDTRESIILEEIVAIKASITKESSSKIMEDISKRLEEKKLASTIGLAQSFLKLMPTAKETIDKYIQDVFK